MQTKQVDYNYFFFNFTPSKTIKTEGFTKNERKWEKGFEEKNIF